MLDGLYMRFPPTAVGKRANAAYWRLVNPALRPLPDQGLGDKERSNTPSTKRSGIQ
jgi:hypothetical protein